MTILGKRCAMCHRYLDHSQFHASRNAADHLQSYCKVCQRRYREKHPTKEWKRPGHDDPSQLRLRYETQLYFKFA